MLDKSGSRQLIFVYNAKGGWLSAAGDMVHRSLSPSTYPCSLCALTYGAVAMRREWRTFLDAYAPNSLFVYRDEFHEDLDACGLSLPVILRADRPGTPEVLVSAEELGALPDLASLTALLKDRLERTRT